MNYYALYKNYEKEELINMLVANKKRKEELAKEVNKLIDKLNKKDEEIERLNKERENDIKYNKYLQKELAKSNNIIKEVRERLIKPSKYIERVERLKLLEILNKEN